MATIFNNLVHERRHKIAVLRQTKDSCKVGLLTVNRLFGLLAVPTSGFAH